MDTRSSASRTIITHGRPAFTGGASRLGRGALNLAIKSDGTIRPRAGQFLAL